MLLSVTSQAITQTALRISHTGTAPTNTIQIAWQVYTMARASQTQILRHPLLILTILRHQ
jgi:hypothetical protein